MRSAALRVLSLLLLLLPAAAAPSKPLHLIVYSGPTTPSNPHTVRLNELYLKNLFFFLNKGLRCSADPSTLYDVVVVVSEENIRTYKDSFHRVSSSTSCHSVRFVPQDRTCYDVGNYKTAIAAVHIKKYQSFTFLNCGLLGPFQEDYSSYFWPQKFRSRIDESTKLVGITAHCGDSNGQTQAQSHVQSMIWNTDSTGLHVVLEAGVFFECSFNGTSSKSSYNHLRQGLINTYELGLSRAVMQQGYHIAVINSYQQNLRFSLHNATHKPFPKNCVDLWQPDYLYRMKKFHDLNPFELLFWKNTRRHSVEALEHFDGILKDHGIHVKDLKIELAAV